MKKLNVLFGFGAVAALVATAAVSSGTRTYAEELDTSLKVDYWNTTGHVNPTVAYVSDSVNGLGIEVGTAARSADCLGGGSLDVRAVYEAKDSASISFTSEALGLSVIVR